MNTFGASGRRGIFDWSGPGRIDGWYLPASNLQWHHLVCVQSPCRPSSLADLQHKKLQDGVFSCGCPEPATYRTCPTLLRGWAGTTAMVWKLLTGATLLGMGMFNLLEGVIDHENCKSIMCAPEPIKPCGTWAFWRLPFGFIFCGWRLRQHGRRELLVSAHGFMTPITGYAAAGGLEGYVMSFLDMLLGKPLASQEEDEHKIGVFAGVPMLGLDALGSSAYGPEAALTLLLPLGAWACTMSGPSSWSSWRFWPSCISRIARPSPPTRTAAAPTPSPRRIWAPAWDCWQPPRWCWITSSTSRWAFRQGSARWSRRFPACTRTFCALCLGILA